MAESRVKKERAIDQREFLQNIDPASGMLLNLYEMTNKITALDSLNGVIDEVITTIKKITGCLRISVMLLSEDGEYLYIKKAIGINENIIKSTKIRIGEKIAGKAFSGRRIISSDPKAFNSKYFFAIWSFSFSV